MPRQSQNEPGRASASAPSIDASSIELIQTKSTSAQQPDLTRPAQSTGSSAETKCRDNFSAVRICLGNCSCTWPRKEPPRSNSARDPPNEGREMDEENLGAGSVPPLLHRQNQAVGLVSRRMHERDSGPL